MWNCCAGCIISDYAGAMSSLSPCLGFYCPVQELLDWQQLGKAQKAVAMPNGWQQQEQALQLQVVQTFLQLPPDLQTALFSSPIRQEQLQEAAAALAAGKSAEQGAAAAVLQKMQELMISAGAGADAPMSQS